MIKKIIFFLLGLALFVGCLMTVFAETYFVNGGGAITGRSVELKGAVIDGRLVLYQPQTYTPSRLPVAAGSDANDGKSLDAPFLTLNKACRSATNAGDVVTIYPGTYAEVATNKYSGTKANPITYQSSGTDPVIIHGFYSTNEWIVLDGKNTMTFTADSNSVPASAYRGAVTLHNGSRNCVLKNFSAFSPQQDPTHSAIAACSVYAGQSSSSYYADQTWLTNNWFENIVFTNQGFDNVNIKGDHVVVTNCFWQDEHGWDALRIHANNALVTGCTFSNYSNPGITNVLHTDLWQTFPNNGENGTNLVFEKNIVYNCRDQVQFNFGANRGGTNENFKTLHFRDNIIYNMTGEVGTYMPNTWIYNNTFYGIWFSASWKFLMDASHGDAYNGRNFNNVFYGCGQTSPTNDPANSMAAYDSYSTVAGSNFSGGGVFYFTNDYNFAAGWANQGKLWMTNKNEPHGVNGGDPKFNGLGMRTGFIPLVGSPLIAAGTNLSSWYPGGQASDFYGRPRPTTGAWSIGACEP